MPIQEEERASGKLAAKAKPTLKPSSTNNWNFIPMEQRKRIDIKVERSKDPYCFQMSKFITQLLRHEEVGPLEESLLADSLASWWDSNLRCSPGSCASPDVFLHEFHCLFDGTQNHCPAAGVQMV